MSINNKISAKKILKSFVISVTLVLTVLVSVGYLYVNQAGGLRRLLESELSLMAGTGNASVGSVNLRVSMSQYPFQLTASDIIIDFGSDQIELPRADIRFGIASLLDGQPEMLLLKGVKLDLVAKKSGWSGSPTLLFLDWIAKDPNKIPAASAANPAAIILITPAVTSAMVLIEL